MTARQIVRRAVMTAVFVGLCLSVVVTPTAWVYNLVPGFRVAPNEQERSRCDREFGEDFYHFSIIGRGWECTDNWRLLFFDAGVHGV